MKGCLQLYCAFINDGEPEEEEDPPGETSPEDQGWEVVSIENSANDESSTQVCSLGLFYALI